MKRKFVIGVAAAALVLGAVTAYAQMQHGPGMHHGHHGAMQNQPQHAPGSHAAGTPKGDNSAPSLAFNAVNQKMHQAMDITYTGNVDVDFVRGMIPHHQGAIDMAKIVLAFGKDPQIKKLAEEIIKAQESEIAMMQDWLSKNAK